MFISKKILSAQKNILDKFFGIKKALFWRGFCNPPGRIDFSELQNIISKISAYSNTSFSPELKENELMPYYRINAGASSYYNYCLAPWTQVNLLPNGDIYTCPDYILGNIKTREFSDIWNGEKAKSLRSYLRKNIFPACRGCFFYYTDRNE